MTSLVARFQGHGRGTNGITLVCLRKFCFIDGRIQAAPGVSDFPRSQHEDSVARPAFHALKARGQGPPLHPGAPP